MLTLPCLSRCLAGPVLCLAGWLVAVPSQAQFAMVPSPLAATPQASEAESGLNYKRDAAKHLYLTYPMRVYKGRMPPLLYGGRLSKPMSRPMARWWMCVCVDRPVRPRSAPGSCR